MWNTKPAETKSGSAQQFAFPVKPIAATGLFDLDLDDPLAFNPVVDSPPASAKKPTKPTAAAAASAAAAAASSPGDSKTAAFTLPAYTTSAPIPIPSMQLNESLAALYDAQAKAVELKVERGQLALSRAQQADQKRAQAAKNKEEFTTLIKPDTKLHTLSLFVDSLRGLCNQRSDDAIWIVSTQVVADHGDNLDDDFEANWRHFVVPMWAGKISNAIAYIIQKCGQQNLRLALKKPKLWDFITDDQLRYSLAVVVSTMHMRGDGRWKKDKDYADNALDEADAFNVFLNAMW